MKKIILFLFIFLISTAVAQDFSTEEIKFKGKELSAAGMDPNSGELEIKFNIAYSPILPAGAIYSLMDISTGYETIVQIGFAPVNHDPLAIYLPDQTFNFFQKPYDIKTDSFNLKVKFLAWNKEGESSEYLNIKSLVVDHENSISKIALENPDDSYIQIGSFRHYQNAYPMITEMLPFLEIKPNFYLVASEIFVDNKKQTIYRIFAGPYDKSSANKLRAEINEKKGKTVFIKTGDSIVKENRGNKK